MGKKTKKGQRTKRDYHEVFFERFMENLNGAANGEDMEQVLKIGMLVEAASQGVCVKPGAAGKLAAKLAPSIASFMRKQLAVTEENDDAS